MNFEERHRWISFFSRGNKLNQNSMNHAFLFSWVMRDWITVTLLTMAIRSNFSWRRRSLSIERSHKCCHRLDKCSKAGWFLSSVVEPDRVNEEPGLVTSVNFSRDRSRVKDGEGLEVSWKKEALVLLVSISLWKCWSALHISLSLILPWYSISVLNLV